jgi:hypothetical protein
VKNPLRPKDAISWLVFAHLSQNDISGPSDSNRGKLHSVTHCDTSAWTPEVASRARLAEPNVSGIEDPGVP